MSEKVEEDLVQIIRKWGGDSGNCLVRVAYLKYTQNSTWNSKEFGPMSKFFRENPRFVFHKKSAGKHEVSLSGGSNATRQYSPKSHQEQQKPDRHTRNPHRQRMGPPPAKSRYQPNQRTVNERKNPISQRAAMFENRRNNSSVSSTPPSKPIPSRTKKNDGPHRNYGRKKAPPPPSQKSWKQRPSPPSQKRPNRFIAKNSSTSPRNMKSNSNRPSPSSSSPRTKVSTSSWKKSPPTKNPNQNQGKSADLRSTLRGFKIDVNKYAPKPASVPNFSENESLKGNKELVYASGNRYVGELCSKTQKRDGSGTYYFRNGEKYVGHFNQDKRNGQGKMYYKSGELSYDGSWENDVKCGIGTYSYPNGERYEGSWKNNVKDGNGVYYYGSGGEFLKYDGGWKNNVKDGKGMLHYRNGKGKLETLWRNNKMVKVVKLHF